MRVLVAFAVTFVIFGVAYVVYGWLDVPERTRPLVSIGSTLFGLAAYLVWRWALV